MAHKFIKIGVWFGLFALLAWGMKGAQTIHYTIQPTSQLYLVGTTNINTFTCHCQNPATKGSFQLRETENRQGFQCINAILKIKTESFDCHNRLMNRDLYRAMKTTQYPYITIQMLDIAPLSENLEKTQHWAEAKANVQITLTHVSKTMPLTVKVCKIAPKKYHFVSQTDILMTDFGITPPTPGLGLIKVRNKITIHLNLIASVE
jgi:hypothetical protein